MSDVRNSRLYLDVGVGSVDLLHEVGVNMRGNGDMAAVEGDSKLLEVVHLRGIIVLEVDGIVDMSELVGVEET